MYTSTPNGTDGGASLDLRQQAKRPRSHTGGRLSLKAPPHLSLILHSSG